MERICHELVQGTPEWDAFRLEHDGASEAAPMLGLSKNVTRNELLHAKHTGLPKEFSDFVREKILEHGHAVEALARPIIEELIGEDLYPATYSYGRLSASCDGLTMDGETAFEHKQHAKELAASVARGELPIEHRPQCQQIMLVTGAKRVIFTVSDGTRENCVHMEVFPDQACWAQLEAGWAQFHEDLKTYQPPEYIPAAVAKPVMALPALSIQVEGKISLIDNLALFGVKLNEFIENLDLEPETDQGFADAEAAVKTLKAAQDALEAAEANALAQTSSIDEMRRTVKLYADQAKKTRLLLNNMVTDRKEKLRLKIVQGGKDALAAHVASLNTRLGHAYMPPVAADFAGSIKGMRKLDAMRNAIDTTLANAKLEANAIADRIQVNLNSLRDLAGEYKELFADTAQIVMKSNDDLVTLITLRISQNKAAEQKKADELREKIRKEEEAKAAQKVLDEKTAAEKLALQQAAPAPIPVPVVQEAANTPQPPTPGPAAPAAAKPRVTMTTQGPRPSVEAIIALVATTYRVDSNTARKWLMEINLQQAA